MIEQWMSEKGYRLEQGVMYKKGDKFTYPLYLIDRKGDMFIFSIGSKKSGDMLDISRMMYYLAMCGKYTQVPFEQFVAETGINDRVMYEYFGIIGKSVVEFMGVLVFADMFNAVRG
jgi:hypothetical protein